MQCRLSKTDAHAGRGSSGVRQMPVRRFLYLGDNGDCQSFTVTATMVPLRTTILYPVSIVTSVTFAVERCGGAPLVG